MKKLNITILVTTLCNMKCTYCYENHYSKEKMTYFTADKIIEFIVNKILFSKSDTLIIRFHGGEPLLEYQLLTYFMDQLENNPVINKINIYYLITTNGTLYNLELSGILKKFSKVSISIDGDRETHNRNRIFKNGRGSYDILKKNTIRMLNDNLALSARITVTNQTSNNLFTNFVNIVKIGLNTIDIDLDILHNWTIEELQIFEENFKKIADYVYENNKNGKKLCVPKLIGSKNKLKNSICSGGHLSFTITPNGQVYPCLASINHPEFLLGSANEELCNDIRLNILDCSQKEIISCIGCTRYDYCEATKCRIINKIYMDDFCKPYPVICAMENINVRIGKYYFELLDKSISG